MADVYRVAPWIDTLLIGDGRGLSLDLAEQRHRATTRLDELLIQFYRPFSRLGLGRSGYQLGDAGSGSWSTMQNYGNWAWLRNALDSGKLMIDGDRGERPREICARYAVSYACENQIGKGPEETSFQALGDFQRTTGDNLLAGYVAEIDLNGDGMPDLWIDCGRRSVR